MTQGCSLAVHLTAIRGKVRRIPGESVEKQRLELLAVQIENGASAEYVKRQLDLMVADVANGRETRRSIWVSAVDTTPV
jgi:hypothetical protein